MELPFTRGDIVESQNPASLAKTAKIVAITEQSFTAEVIEGANMKAPLIVFRAGWSMYRKVAKLCPKCGKPMEEEPNFKGYWRCPDYKTALNDTAPFQFKCTGSQLTEEGAEEFDKALAEAWLRQMKDKASLN